MARAGTGLIDKLAERRVLNRWSRISRSIESAEPGELRALRNGAREIHAQSGRFIRSAERQLSLPRSGSDVIRAPAEANWKWRPEFWRSHSESPGHAPVKSGDVVDLGVKIFHDCPLHEISLRQTRNTHETDLAPFGLTLDVYHFEGSYLSVAVDLPQAAWNEIRAGELMRIDALVDTDRPVTAFARLNLRHGPNIERSVGELKLAGVHEEAEFDLDELLASKPIIEAAWIEILFEVSPMTQIVLRDLTASRRPRAQF